MAGRGVSWSIVWTSRAEKELKKLDGSFKPVIKKALSKLKSDPFGSQTEKLTGVGNLRSIRAGAHCRIIYRADGGRIVVEILRVGTHENIYANVDRL